jgi:hypothetical protein
LWQAGLPSCALMFSPSWAQLHLNWDLVVCTRKVHIPLQISQVSPSIWFVLLSFTSLFMPCHANTSGSLMSLRKKTDLEHTV